ncbi:hypothetical protein F0562_002054 [Nyssa sinensis]|uniref:PHD-type domain-containing protein n=1 Tax=Nyssa sinensis TaxID=561372 RepID=A0A5J5C8P0_9ASTE|nr:hypothetical protein F0562_002054 [Nyssa sinensis]
MDSHQNTCAICKLGGKLLCCHGKGCNRSYHPSCLDPPLNDVSLGVWHCFLCVNKKIESGVHSVAEGIESIWDSREVEMPESEGLRKQKQYFVKYKGLAHVHNHWVPETQLHLEAQSLVAKFDQQNQVTRWKLEWTVPQRLLRKRLITSQIQTCYMGVGECFFSTFTSHSQILVREYENRREKAQRNVSFSRVDKCKKESSVKTFKAAS